MASSAPYNQSRPLDLTSGQSCVPWSDVLQVQGKTVQIDGDGGTTPTGTCQIQISIDGVEWLDEGSAISTFPAVHEISKSCTHIRVKTTSTLTHTPVARLAGVIY